VTPEQVAVLVLFCIMLSAILCSVIPFLVASKECGIEQAQSENIWGDDQFNNCVYAKLVLNVNGSDGK